MMTQFSDSRRFDIDWLRTLAFILLIFYHIGQFYVLEWNWHVKSDYQSEFLRNIMLLVNQWRMPLIFLVSGIALSLVESKISSWQLLKLRFIRVFIPLVIGMYLIVPPQLFFELVQKESFTGSYIEFFSYYIDPDTSMFPNYQYSPAGLLTWNHLWYLPYLMSYSIIYLIFKPVLNHLSEFFINFQPSAVAIFLLPTMMLIIYAMKLGPIYPKTHALFDDWYNHAVSFSMFLFGVLLARSPLLWQRIIQYRKIWLLLAILNYIVVIIRYNRAFGFDVDYQQASLFTQIFIEFIWRANSILWLLSVIGMAGAYLNRSHPLLSYMNKAVLPWYILHQSVIVVVAMLLSEYSLGPVVEPLLVIILTFAICFIGYELIKRNNLTRFMFGMKLKQAEPSLHVGKSKIVSS